jgi:uncharacterized protein YndB with AHSA1/START domain
MLQQLQSSPPHRMIITEKIFDAPWEIVFRAWTDPAHLKNWWCPSGFAGSFSEFDLKPGGWWKFIVHGTDQRNYENESVFIQVRDPSQLAFTHVTLPGFHVLTTYDEVDKGLTGVVFRMIFGTIEDAEKLRSFVTEKNEENMDRLYSELKKMAGNN